MRSPFATITVMLLPSCRGSWARLATSGSTKLCVLPVSINTVTYCWPRKPTSRMVLGAGVPKMAWSEISTTSSLADASSLGSTIEVMGLSSLFSPLSLSSKPSNKNTLGVLHLCPGTHLSSQ
ncbi:hypothetical protein I3843_16G092400 [Carya illinoinensis]|nr:hypothetical protein I3760_16G094700 [Carya illinoinensis]KAG7942245.1 hypothetical protein I3843_16G092400 [Carya illinoinensis]